MKFSLLKEDIAEDTLIREADELKDDVDNRENKDSITGSGSDEEIEQVPETEEDMEDAVEVDPEENSPVEMEVPVEPVAQEENEITIGLNSLVNNLWNFSDQIDAIIQAIEIKGQDEKIKESITRILNEIKDDCLINVGMLYKAIELHSPELSLLLSKGQNKASEVTISNKE